MEQLGVAVIGTGLLGERHTRVWAEMPEVNLVAVADAREERAREVAGKFGVDWYSDYTQMLKDERIAAISVATPDHLHREPVIACLQAGKHVLTEKPLATTIEDATAMLRVAKEMGKVLMVNYSQRFVPEFAWVKKVVDDGVIGVPQMAQSLKHDAISVPTGMIRSWASKSTPIFFMSSHDMDLIRWYMDSDPVEVMAYSSKGTLTARGCEAPDGIQVLVRFESGAMALFHSSWIHPNTFPSIGDSYFELIGSKGVIYLKRGRVGELYHERGAETITFGGPQTANELEGRLAGAFPDALQLFIESIRTGEEPMISAEKTIMVTVLQCAVEDSIAEGRPVKLSEYASSF